MFNLSRVAMEALGGEDDAVEGKTGFAGAKEAACAFSLPVGLKLTKMNCLTDEKVCC